MSVSDIKNKIVSRSVALYGIRYRMSLSHPTGGSFLKVHDIHKSLCDYNYVALEAED
jgi:hypothetical protein